MIKSIEKDFLKHNQIRTAHIESYFLPFSLHSGRYHMILDVLTNVGQNFPKRHRTCIPPKNRPDYILDGWRRFRKRNWKGECWCRELVVFASKTGKVGQEWCKFLVFVRKTETWRRWLVNNSGSFDFCDLYTRRWSIMIWLWVIDSCLKSVSKICITISIADYCVKALQWWS